MEKEKWLREYCKIKGYPHSDFNIRQLDIVQKSFGFGVFCISKAVQQFKYAFLIGEPPDPFKSPTLDLGERRDV